MFGFGRTKVAPVQVSGVADNGEIVNGEIVEDEDMTPPKYYGVVASVHDGYCFLHQIRRGYETVATNGDVFVPQIFEVGAYVEFDSLNSDPKRPGKFRAESAKIVESGLVTIEPKSAAVALRELMAPHIYHRSAKKADPAEVEKVIANKPFPGFIEELAASSRELAAEEGAPEDNIARKAEEFLQETFAALIPLGVSYSVNSDVDEAEEQAKIDEAVVLYGEEGMTGQVESLRKEYEYFKGVRKAFTLMRTAGILGLDTVVPIKFMPEMFVSMPVWYVHSKAGLDDLTISDDPAPDHAIKFFCDLVGTKEFAWMYQMMNRRTRPIGPFKGRDIMPPSIMKILSKAKGVFDYVVIQTPYLDMVSRELEDPNWLRSIDPRLVGFIKGIPYMFVLGRWSGTGLFPLFADMVADTMNWLRLNKSKMGNFIANTYWYKGDNGGCLSNGGSKSRNNVLQPFAEQVIAAFDEGRLFEFLRGETPAQILDPSWS